MGKWKIRFPSDSEAAMWQQDWAPIRARLKSVSELNKNLKRIEDSLLEDNPGVVAHVVLPTGELLQWSRRERRWGFYICANEKDEHISEATLEDRLLAAEHMDSLLAMLVANTKGALERVRAANKLLREQLGLPDAEDNSGAEESQ